VLCLWLAGLHVPPRWRPTGGLPAGRPACLLRDCRDQEKQLTPPPPSPRGKCTPSCRDQENFQLIVITHDELFAQSIGTREHAELMWRITKDDTQHTHLAQQAIME